MFFVQSRGLSLISSFFDDVTSGSLVFMFGRADPVPQTRSQTSRNTRAVKLVTWYKIRPSDWSIQKILQSDWLVRIPPPYTTDVH